jgi:cyanuric acid amidohydrolase
MREASLAPADVELVQVKGPCDPAAPDPNKSMALSRVAGAFGVGIALGEIAQDFSEAAFFSELGIHSSKASCSSGVEVQVNEVMVLGNSAAWSGPLSIASRPMRDALDLDAALGVLEDLDVSRTPQSLARVRAAIVKGEPDPRGRVRGHRHTMLTDGDMNAQRHIRGALGGLVAGVLGDGRIFVSGGAEHQGPAGGGLVAIIAE